MSKELMVRKDFLKITESHLDMNPREYIFLMIAMTTELAIACLENEEVATQIIVEAQLQGIIQGRKMKDAE